MKQITIKCNNNIDLLKCFLQTNLESANLHFLENDIIVYLNNKNQLETLSLTLAIFCIDKIETDLLDKIAKTIPKETYNHKVFLQIQDFYRKFLYIEPFKILVLEYLKKNDILNIDSFLTFNCRGIQKDFYNLGKDYIQLYSHEVNNQKISAPLIGAENARLNTDGAFVDSTVAYYSYIVELNEMILKLKNESNISKLDYKKFNEIHLKAHKGVLTLTDNGNDIIESYIDEILPVRVVNALNGKDVALRMAIILLTCISVLKTSCIVFHKTIPQEILSRILLFLYDSKEVNKELESVNLLKCNSCDLCNLPNTR